jgi:excisionase family DNA binding protein
MQISADAIRWIDNAKTMESLQRYADWSTCGCTSHCEPFPCVQISVDFPRRGPGRKTVLGQMEPFVTAKRVAEFCGLSPRTINRMAREGRLPAHPVSGTARRTWRFKLSEVETCLVAPTPTIEAGRPNPADRGKP